MPFVEDRREFLKRHGGDPVPVSTKTGLGTGGGLLLPDGAIVQFATIYYPEWLIEPPHDVKQRLLTRRAYHTIKLRTFEEAFNRLKFALAPGGIPVFSQPFHWDESVLGPNPGGGMNRDKAALVRLKTLADEHRNAVADLNRQIADLPEMRELRRRQQEAREWNHKLAEMEYARHTEIEAITL